MADPSNVDTALMTVLQNDATLIGYLPDGVYMDVAPSGRTQFAIVSLVAHEDTPVLGAMSHETAHYLVKAVDRATTGTNVKSAADRIHTLLNLTTLTITGYTHMLTRRTERIRYTEVDESNNDIRWQHRGGRYEIWVSPS